MFIVGTRVKGTQGTGASWGCAKVSLFMIKFRECVGPCISESSIFGPDFHALGPYCACYLMANACLRSVILQIHLRCGSWFGGVGKGHGLEMDVVHKCRG